jgi:hypothetical protein
MLSKLDNNTKNIITKIIISLSLTIILYTFLNIPIYYIIFLIIIIAFFTILHIPFLRKIFFISFSTILIFIAILKFIEKLFYQAFICLIFSFIFFLIS